MRASVARTRSGCQAGDDDHAVGELARERLHLRTGRGEIDRDRPSCGLDRQRAAVEVGGLAREERAQEADLLPHAREARRLQSERLDGAVAAPDAEDEAARRELVDGRGRRCGHGRMACLEVGDAGAEGDRARLRGREGERTPDVAPEELGVRQPGDVEARFLRVAHAGGDLVQGTARRDAQAETGAHLRWVSRRAPVPSSTRRSDASTPRARPCAGARSRASPRRTRPRG